jgi:hypothetical protein
MPISKEAKAAYDKARRERWKAEHPDWSEIERARGLQPEVRERRRQRAIDKHDERLAYQRTYRAAHRDEMNAYLREYRRNNPLSQGPAARARREARLAADPIGTRVAEHATRIHYLFGITADRYMELFHAQGGVCAVCGKAETRVVRGTLAKLAIDHDHGCCPGAKSCGNCVRGLVCSLCNRFMGLAQDDPALLRAAAAYIEQHATRIAAS